MDAVSASHRTSNPMLYRFPLLSFPVQGGILPGGQGLVNGLAQGGAVKPSCQVNGALSINGVPARGVGGAEKLDFQSHTYHRLICSHPFDAFCCIKCCPAGCPAHHIYPGDTSVLQVNCHLRRAKEFPIPSKADLPRQCASCGGGKYTLGLVLFARGYHRYAFFQADEGKVVG